MTLERVTMLAEAILRDSNERDKVTAYAVDILRTVGREGERPCERCKERSRLSDVPHTFADCPDCNGKTPADRLVSRNAVVEALRKAEEGEWPMDGDRLMYPSDFIKRKFWGSE